MLTTSNVPVSLKVDMQPLSSVHMFVQYRRPLFSGVEWYLYNINLLPVASAFPLHLFPSTT